MRNFFSLTLLFLLLAGCTAAPGSSSQDDQARVVVDIHCTDTDPHPMALSISETYDVTYEQVMTWFCSGYSFENILIALETGEATDMDPDLLLQMLLEKDWEEIWDEVGLTNGT